MAVYRKVHKVTKSFVKIMSQFQLLSSK